MKLRSTAMATIGASLVVSASAFLVSAPAQATQTCQSTPLASFVNGSFEQPAIPAQSNYSNFSNSQMVGWVSTDPLVSTYPNLAFEVWGDGFIGEPSQDGTQFIELEANGAATVFQDFATTPGQVLAWSFYLTPRHNFNAFAKLSVVLGNAAGTTVVSTPVQQLTTGWQRHSGTYTVPSGQTTTRLTFVSDPAFSTMDATLQMAVGPNHLDNVQVATTLCTTTPDPVVEAITPVVEAVVPEQTLAQTGAASPLLAPGSLGLLALAGGIASLYVSTRSSARRSRGSTPSTSPH